MLKPKPELYKGTNKIVRCGFYEGLRYYIKDGVICPCAYICLPDNLYKEGIGFGIIYNTCHGGLTYSGELYDHKMNKLENNVVGWDYGHIGDFIGSEVLSNDTYSINQLQQVRKWTINEIEKEIQEVINKYKNYLTI